MLQGVHDNYETDTFKALIEASEELTRTKAEGDSQASHRVIADHLRASGFLVADGVLPANEGRGYVLRRIMRRAMRHAHLLGAKEPLMHRLVPALVAEMGAAYPELVRAQPLIEATLQQEETRFRQTLVNGLKLLDEATAALGEGGTLPGETAFKLYDTFGFPYDLTEDALRAPRPRRRPRRLRRGDGRAEGRGARGLEGLGRPGVATSSGSTSPRSMARPSSPATRATRPRAWCWRSSRTGSAVDSAEAGDDGAGPAQPDALLRRERRADRRHRKTHVAQWLRRRG